MSVQDLLIPGGSAIGSPGGKRQNRHDIREVAGGQTAADQLFARLAKDGVANTPSGYPGTAFDLPGGGWIGLRPVSKSGPPTIDIDIPNIPIKKIKFV